MARGFGGETTAQEARGNEGLSSSDIAGGRQDAANSAMASGRDVDPGGGNDGSGGFLSNDYTPDFNCVSQIQDIMQAQETFNRSRGITDTNPFGIDNIFTKYLGIDPKNIDYTDNIIRSNRISIANNQFSKFMNPQNKPGMVGYNPDFPTAGEGQLRAGAQSAGYKTQFGDVMEQARKQSTGEMIARGAMGLFGGPVGMLMGQLGTQEYGLPGQPGFESFDPNNPQQGGGFLGAMLGGLNPTQAKEAITEFFSAPVAAPTKVGIESLKDWSEGRAAAKQQAMRDAVSSVMSQAQTSPSIANMSLEDKKTAISELADQNYQSYKDKMPDISDQLSSGYNFYGDPDAGASYPKATMGEQLAMGFKGLESGYSQQVYDELRDLIDRKSTRLNSSHGYNSYAVFCLKKKKKAKKKKKRHYQAPETRQSKGTDARCPTA